MSMRYSDMTDSKSSSNRSFLLFLRALLCLSSLLYHILIVLSLWFLDSYSLRSSRSKKCWWTDIFIRLIKSIGMSPLFFRLHACFRFTSYLFLIFWSHQHLKSCRRPKFCTRRPPDIVLSVHTTRSNSGQWAVRSS